MSPRERLLQLSFGKEDLGDELFRLYFGDHHRDCGCSLHQLPVFTLAIESRKALSEKALSEIWETRNDRLTPVNESLFSLYSRNYYKAVDDIFTEERIPEDLVRKFKQNVSRLASAKAYSQQCELASLAAGSTGKAAFLRDSKGIAGKYNRYQAAEYNTITARTRTAKQFERFIRESKRYPNIEWIRTRSSSPRELHLSYVGIVLPVSHPFWQNNQPGNLWNCKCDWRTTDKSSTAEPERIVRPAKGLEGNPATTGELVTENHPYFKDKPGWASNNGLLMAPDEVVYEEVKTSYGIFREHVLTRKEQEKDENRVLAAFLLKRGYKDVRLLPKIYASENALRIRYYGKEYGSIEKTMCPDCLADGIVIEFKKSAGSIISINDRIRDAAKKSSIVVLRLSEPLPVGFLNNHIPGRKALYNNVKAILVINGRDVLEY